MNNVDSLKILKDSGCLCCEECRSRLDSFLTEDGAANKRRRLEDLASTSASTSAAATPAEEIIASLRRRNATLEENIVLLRQQIDQLSGTSQSSARSERMDTARDTASNEPATLGQMVKMISDSQKAMMDDMKKMCADLISNQRNQPVLNQIRQSRGPISFADVVRNRSASTNRQRSNSRSRDPSLPPPRNNNPTRDNMRKRQQQPLLRFNPAVSTAQAFAVSPIETNNRFNILSTIDNDVENFTVTNEIQGSAELSKVAKVKTIIKRSNRCLAVEAETEDDANRLKVVITQKFAQGIIITTPQPHKPQIKITGCAISDINEDNIKAANPWIVDEIRIVRFYDVGREPRMYRNYIIELSLDDHTEVLRRKKLIIGFMQCNAHEFVDPIPEMLELCAVCGRQCELFTLNTNHHNFIRIFILATMAV